jgi:hypothetical protein
LFTNDPGLKAALQTLNDNWPWTVSRHELVDEVQRRLLDAGFTPGADAARHVDNLIGALIVQGSAQFRLEPVRPFRASGGHLEVAPGSGASPNSPAVTSRCSMCGTGR